MSQQYPQGSGPRRQQPPPWPQQQQPGYSQRDYYSPHVHQNVPSHIPEQWQGKPPVIEPFTYPGKPQRERRRPPFPSHRMQFPWELVTFKGGSRGPSIWRMAYLGTHPLALLMSVFLAMSMAAGVLAWGLLVAAMWLAWCAVITVVWVFRVAFSALPGLHRGRI